MKPNMASAIHSFVIRFVVRESTLTEEIPPAYHGSVRHIQSAEELHFREWPEAVEFMRRYIHLDELNEKPNLEK